MSSLSSLIAITGGTGFVGQTLIEAAAAGRFQMRALARKSQPPHKNVSWVSGDLADRRALAELVQGCEAVIHVAGVVNAPDPEQFTQANVNGTLAMLEAARDAGVPRFIFVSSLSAREPELSAYGASKARAEQLVKASGLDWTIVRPPAIYGPRDKEMFELFRAAKWRMVPVPPAGSASVIHVEDLARLLLALVPGGGLSTTRSFEPDDGKPGGWDHVDLARAIGVAMGTRPFVLRMPRRIMELAARLDMALRRGDAKLTLDRVGYMTHPDWVVSEESQVPDTIWKPRIETRGGLVRTAQWYRREEWL